jgi:hypothetical protein
MSKKVKGKKAAASASKTLTKKSSAEPARLSADSALSQTQPLDDGTVTNPLTEATAADNVWSSVPSHESAENGSVQQVSPDRNIAFWMWA